MIVEGPHFLGGEKGESGGVFGYFCLCGDDDYDSDLIMIRIRLMM